MTYKPGDRFKVVGHYPGNDKYEGKFGTVNVVRGPKDYTVSIDGCGKSYDWHDSGDMQRAGRFPLKVGSVIQNKRDKSVHKITAISEDFGFTGVCIKEGSSYKKGNTGTTYELGDYTVLNGSNNNSMLQTVGAMLKRLLDADSQKLYKAGFINGDLELTDEGTSALMSVLFDANKAALVKEAEEVIAEEERKSK